MRRIQHISVIGLIGLTAFFARAEITQQLAEASKPLVEGVPEVAVVRLQTLLKQKVEIRGTTDLTLGNLKFSGNAQRRRRNFLLFHGSFLLQFDLKLIGQLLKFPSRQPDYRADRPHSKFLTHLTVSAHDVKNSLRKEWNANEPLAAAPMDAIEGLVRTRYSTEAWNLRW